MLPPITHWRFVASLLVYILLSTSTAHAQALVRYTADSTQNNQGSLGGTFTLDGIAVSGDGMDGSFTGLDIDSASGMGGNGGAARLDNLDANGLNALKSFTIAAWIQSDGLQSQARIAHRFGSFSFYANNPGDRLGLTIDGSSRSDGSGSNFVYSKTNSNIGNAGEWIFVVGQWRASDGEIQFYVGTENDSGLTPVDASLSLNATEMLTVSRELYLGSNNVLTQGVKGAMDNVSIYGSATDDSGFLSQAQLESVFLEDRDQLGIHYPSDAGIIDVTQAPYNATGDGVTDDTAAIQSAIDDALGHKADYIIYLPNGTYRVTDRLAAIDPNAGDWNEIPGLMIQGQDERHTIIQLDDTSSGYGTPGSPRAVIYFGSDAVGNGSFGNYLENLTVRTGSGNSGAIGVDYVTSNYGAIRHVRIISGDGSGVSGLRCNRNYQGPGLVSQVEISGFDTGIEMDQANYHMTFEHLTLLNQNTVGIFANGLVAAIRGLSSNNTVPALRVDMSESLVSLLDADLQGGTANAAVEILNGALYARNLSVGGYINAIDDRGTTIAGPNITEWSSPDQQHGTFDSPASMLGLPIEETPEFDESNLDLWVNVRDFGADPNDTTDDRIAIQNAIDYADANGKTVVYFPPADATSNKYFYRIDAPLNVYGSIRQLKGLRTRLEAYNGSYNSHNPLPFIVFGQSDHNEVFVDHFHLRNATRYVHKGIEHSGSQDLVLKSTLGAYQNTASSGNLYLEDFVSAGLLLEYPKKVWARQLNAEDFYQTKIINNGGDVWVLGLKTERNSPTTASYSNARTEVLGQFSLGQWSSSDDLPMVFVEESAFSGVAKPLGQSGNYWDVILRESRNGSEEAILPADLGSRQPAATLTAYAPGFTQSNLPFVRYVSGAMTTAEDELSGTTLEFERTGSTAASLSVTLTLEGSAIAGSDYSISPNPLVFQVGETRASVTLTPLNDSEGEFTEQAIVRLAGDTNWLVGFPSQAVFAIEDDDHAALSYPSTNLAAAFHPGQKLLFDSSNRITQWDDQSGNGNHLRGYGFMPENRRHPKWSATALDGEPGLIFDQDLLQLYRSSTIANASFDQKHIILNLKTGSDVTTRQVVLQQGHAPNGGGLMVYLENGNLYFTVQGQAAGWQPAWTGTAISPDTSYTTEFIFDHPASRLEIYLDGTLSSSGYTGTLGTIPASFDFSTLGGAEGGTLFPGESVEYNRPDHHFVGIIGGFLQYNSVLNTYDAELARNFVSTGLNVAPAFANSTESVSETATLGSSVATLNASDSNTGQTLAWSIVSGNNDGKFAIDSNGELTTAGELDYENTSQYNLTVRVSDDGTPSLSTDALITIAILNVDEGPNINQGIVTSVSTDSWTSVDFSQGYVEPVIIATPVYPDGNTPPLVTRLRNVTGSSFELQLQRIDGLTTSVAADVAIVAFETGLYTVGNDGVKMEVVRFDASITGQDNNWTADSRNFQQSYTQPIVLGQVMSDNDSDWSVFWSSKKNDRKKTAEGADFWVGKHVAEDPDTTRSSETLGYIVIEAGTGNINGLPYATGQSSKGVLGIDDSPTGYSIATQSVSNPSTAVINMAAQVGINGGWGILIGVTPIGSDQLQVVIDEDQLGDTERNHTYEWINYLTIGQ